MPNLQAARYAARGAVARWFEEPASLALARIGFTPNLATLAGLLLAGAAAYWAAVGEFLIAGVFVAAGSTFDMLDGGIARRTGRVSKRGALLDSVADRVAEGLVLLGLLIYFSNPATFSRTGVILAFVALAGSLMVSYVRARAEGLGYKGTAGFLTRPERVVITTVSLLLGYPLAALWILAVGTPLSALHRFWAEWRTAGRENEAND
ncbi:MAG: CDP-alcohol phosphatidyltransferase family protein [Dehalococcoidia bacterium]